MSSTRRGPVSTSLVVRDADDAMDLDAATPQMNVLGRDGRDLVVPMAGDSLEENSAGMQRRRHRQQQWRPPSPDSRVHPDSARSEDSWWKRVQGILSPASSPSKEASLGNRAKVDTMASDTASPSLETNYTSFAEETSENTRSTSRRGLRRAAATKAAPSATDSFMLPSSEDPSSHFQLIPEEENNVSTREDQIRQDCSFFFRSDETSSNNWNHRTDETRNRASLAPSWSLQQLPRERAEYKAKYQQLNQPYDQDSDDEDNVEYYYYQQMENDLSLDTNDKLTLSSSARQEAIAADVANHSTLYYYDGEIGRLLLRLPRDQVRLVMDTDLEPGILSVEQDSRRPQTKTPSAYKRNAGTTNNASSSSLPPAANELPKLNYVLTVSDDLYKRIVSEMSDELTSRYGCYRCCKEGPEHVDIRVAWGILALVLILLLVNTLMWGPLD